MNYSFNRKGLQL